MTQLILFRIGLNEIVEIVVQIYLWCALLVVRVVKFETSVGSYDP